MVYREVVDDGTVRVGGASGGSLVGEIKMWPTATPPAPYLLLDGGTFSSVTYPKLAAILGDTYGTHSGTTYYLPDFRGRTPLGAGLASPAVGGGTTHYLGEKGGEETHLLTAAESGLRAHNHGVTDPGHRHTQTLGGLISTVANGAGAYVIGNANTSLVSLSGTGISINNNTAQNASSRHNVLSPYLGINFIIKAA